MGARKKASAAGKTATETLGAALSAARSSPYVQRVIEDPDVRDNVRVAYDNARDAYGRLSNGKAPTKQLMRDKKLQRQLRDSADALREVTAALREGPKTRRRRGRTLIRLAMVGAAGAGLAVAVSGDVRHKVLDTLFGKEEEFEYTPTTSTNAGPAAPVTPISA
jgi:hypothetical protein